MRKSLLASAAVVAILAGCSGPTGPSREASDVQEEPNISPTAAPGVAWRYSYNYQLRDEVISRVQEAHASACEALGTAKCRITGLSYSVGEDEAVFLNLPTRAYDYEDPDKYRLPVANDVIPFAFEDGPGW